MADIKKIALLFETSNGFDRALLRGITKYSRIHGPWSFYIQSVSKKMKLSRLKNWGVNGIIMRESDLSQKIISMKLPTIISPSAQTPIKNVGNIIGDSSAMGVIAAQHLIDCGFHNFGFCGFDNIPWSRLRAESFNKKIQTAGFQTHLYKQPKTKSQRLWENEQVIMSDWLKQLPKPIGILTCNDERGQHILEACKIAKLHVPEEVAVLGINNDELLCELSNPPLSSIALNTERVGYEAAEILDKLISGKKVKKQIINIKPLYVVNRQSTNILAVEDKDLAEALRFIRQHSKEAIQVGEVADAVGVSRRVLEKRFRKILGRSLHDEIKRVRVEQTAWMLIETNLSISQIAFSLGYAGPEKMSRYFKTEKGISPLYYRNQYSNK